jgi:alkylation response protein AidB-like acyl-CoA dehydrogenase
VLTEAVRRYDGRPVLLLLPLDTAHSRVREQRIGALAGARFGRLEASALPVAGPVLLGTVEEHAPLLRDAVAATRLSLARLLTELADQAVADSLAQASRRPFQGGVLADRQAFRHALVEATAAVRTCHAVTRRAAMAEGTSRWDRAVRAGVFVSRTVPEAVGTACRLAGGQGFMDGHPLATAYREALFAPVLLGGEQRLVDSMRERLAGEAPFPRTASPRTASPRTVFPQADSPRTVGHAERSQPVPWGLP